MTITPAQLAAADAIDVRRYDGHTPGPWIAACNDARGFQIESNEKICGTTPVVCSRGPWQNSVPDGHLITDAYLLPVVVHQRDEARAERDKYLAGCAALIEGDKIYALLAEQDKQLRAERDELRMKLGLLQSQYAVTEATMIANAAERDALREKCAELKELAEEIIAKAEIDIRVSSVGSVARRNAFGRAEAMRKVLEALSPPKDEPRREEE